MSKVKCLHLLKAPPLMTWFRSFWQSLLITWSDSLCTNRKHVHLLHCFWSVHLQAMQCFGSAWSLYPVYCYIHLTSYLLPQVSKVKCLHLLKAHSDNPFWSLEVIRYVPITNTFTCSIVFGLFICKQCNALDQREVYILSIAISIWQATCCHKCLRWNVSTC